MSATVTDFITIYTDWIKQNSAQKIVNGYTEVTTPFLDQHNDMIQFYVQRDGDEFLFTDDGYTLGDLEMNGLTLTSKRKEMVESVAQMLNVEIKDNAITTRTTFPSKVAEKEHIMVQAIMKFGDMFYLASPKIRSLFMDDVKTYFYNSDIRFIPSLMFSGKSGLPQRFDFVIPASRKRPERMIITINQPSQQSVQSAIFSWDDVKSIRKEDSEGYLILNDKTRRNNALIEAAHNRGMNAFWWSEREQYLDLLVS